MRNRREQGMAMVTALLVLLLISAMIVGMSWLVLTDKKLGGNNADRQTAFYGAEAGMEALTTQLQSSFANNYALSASDITTIVNNTQTVTNNIPGVSYLAPNGSNGFEIDFTPDPSAKQRRQSTRSAAYDSVRHLRGAGWSTHSVYHAGHFADGFWFRSKASANCANGSDSGFPVWTFF